MVMHTYVLTDVERKVFTERFDLTAGALGQEGGPGWSVVKHTLRGGRREGVEVVTVDTGAMRFDVLPTRGMGIWKAHAGEMRLGWDSPVRDGPVHPSLVNLEAWGGLGWLDGFDELLVRCGLETNGPPYEEGGRTYTLHGRIAQMPAHHLRVEVEEEEAPGRVSVIGVIDEARLFGPWFRLESRITAEPGGTWLEVRDTITNLKDQACDAVLLYHWNVGVPILGEGARFEAPVRRLCPRTEAAAGALPDYARYGVPSPGSAERVYFHELWGKGPEGRTVVLLKNARGDQGVALRFALSELPRFVLWQNLGGLSDGYVTGLEPTVNYPNRTPYERRQGRTIRLEPGASWSATTVMECLRDRAGVEEVAGEIAALQGQGEAEILLWPVEPWVEP
jgi:hypothetical protein